MFNNEYVYKLTNSLNIGITHNRPGWSTINFKITNNDNNNILVLTKTCYPACCGINILYDFLCNNNLETISEDTLKTFFEQTKGHWKNKTQFVAVRSKIVEWEEDSDGDEYAVVVGYEEKFDYDNFITPLIKYTKAKLISEFINTNSENKCCVYEFDGEDL